MTIENQLSDKTVNGQNIDCTPLYCLVARFSWCEIHSGSNWLTPNC